MGAASPPLNLPLIGIALATASLLMHVAVGAEARLAAALDLIALAGVAVGGIGCLRAVARARRDIASAEVELSGLRRTAEASAQVIDGAGDAIVVIDERATIATFNKAAERMFGYSAGEMIGTSLERLMTDGGRKAHAAYMARSGVTAMVEACRLRTTHKGVRKRGDVFTFELHMTESSVAGRRMFTGILRDVSQRENAADAVRDANARFNAVFEISRDPLFVFGMAGDGSFSLEQMNAAAEAYTGLSRYEVTGWGPDQLAAADERRGLKRGLLDCLSSGQAVDDGARLTSSDGLQMARLSFSLIGGKQTDTRRVMVRAEVDRSANADRRVA